MAGDLSPEPQSFRAGTHLYVVVGGFATLFAAVSIFAAIKQGDWTLPAAVVGGTAVAFGALQVLRLEVGPDGFKYRNLSGSRGVEFAEVSRAYFEIVTANGVSVAAFWVDRSSGKRVKVNLRTFPIRAAAVLFPALEARGIAIEVPDHRGTRRARDQVRAAQAELPRTE